MRSVLVEIMAYEARKIRVWKWIAVVSVGLHLMRSI
tara:strand:- start:4529 stop:4636 length:108 start_codon:yes stop_codon:yes gene_type:complete